MGQKWRFEQLSGKDPRTLELEGWSAPFGRPRQKAIFKESIKVQIQTTHYPGSNAPPTRHVFGSHWEDMEIGGRWMTKALPGDAAPFKADEWTDYIRAARPIRISWGNIISWIGCIEQLDLGYESAHEVVWRMLLKIDKNEQHGMTFKVQAAKNVNEKLFEIFQFLFDSKKQLESLAPDMPLDVFDMLNNLASIMNIPSATLARIAGDFDDLKNASFSTLMSFKNALSGMHASLAQFRETILMIPIDAAVVSRNADSDMKWRQFQIDHDTEIALMLRHIRTLEQEAEFFTSKGDASKLVTAVDGDTWESISIRATGGVGKVVDIRAANGVRYGSRPVPGEVYLIP